MNLRTDGATVRPLQTNNVDEIVLGILKMKSVVCVLLMSLSFPGMVFSEDARPAARVDFRRDVGPVFVRHCLRCHSGKAAKGGFDLSRRKTAFVGGESGAVIVPGRPAKSSLLEMISGKDPEMPKKAKPLTAGEISVVRRWIAAGAKWPRGMVLADRKSEWWSFQPIKAVRVPEISVEQREWIRTPIDAFILRKLRERGLQPSAEASRRTLIRRLTFDLHGLPPTPAQIDAFERDESQNAYETLVDRLLASPRYGERWARHWLDVVHYGDTQGFDKDKRRPHSWPYRDYVIRAFNTDVPYRQFVRDQLAGDVLRPGDAASIAATGFIVAGPWDYVGQVELREGTLDKKITRNLDRDDMVMNTMSTFTSLTVHCARCHNHKFDPITQREYYRLQAVFAGVERADRPYEPNPKIAKRRRELTRRRQRLSAERLQIQKQFRRNAGKALRNIDREIDRVSRLGHGSKRPEFGYHSRIAMQQNVTKWVQVDLKRPTKIARIEYVACHDDFAGIGAGFGFPVCYRIEISNDVHFRNGVTIVVDRTKSDVANPGVTLQSVDLRGRTARYIRVTATKLAPRQNDFIFALAELSAITPDGSNAAANSPVTSLDSIEAPVRWSRRNLVDGHFFGSANPQRAAALGRLRKRRTSLWNRLVSPAGRQRDQRLQREFVQTTTALKRLPPPQWVFAAAANFRRQGNFTPSPLGKPRPVYLLKRGSVKSPGEKVVPGTVGMIGNLPGSFVLKNPAREGERRLALANWIVDRRNPLTFRSIVNRVWHYHFGRGLVDSPNDFGHMGSKPTHPELLDWLAVRFRDNGQSLKQLHRLIVTSAVYRQKSQSDSTRSKIDGDNRFFWRMNRRRLEAEAIRDSVLMVSGRLRSQMYGPGFDRFAFENDHSPRYLYGRHTLDDPRSWRRSVYRFIVRSVPDPFMESLDCADPSLNVPKRNTTITALQALTLLNNRFMIRQAEHFAAMLRESSAQPEQQITAGFRLTLGREPTKRERQLLTPYIRKQGLANFCRLLFNMNEFLFVD